MLKFIARWLLSREIKQLERQREANLRWALAAQRELDKSENSAK